MPKLYVRIANGIAPHLRTTLADGPFSFRYRYPPFPEAVETSIDADGGRIASTGGAEVSQALCDDLAQRPGGAAASQELVDELQSIGGPLARAQRWVLALVRQTIDSPDRHTLTSHPIWWWSRDASVWNERNDPGEYHITRIASRSLPHLDARTAPFIQRHIDNEEEPLLGLEFLYAAERMDEDPYSWVLATTAAELAIKEVLMQLEPSLSTLLLELPSPPIHKLYGRVLKDITGEDFEYTKALQKGAEVRNKIVHKPSAFELNPQEAVDYVATVHQALRELLRVARRVRSGGT